MQIKKTPCYKPLDSPLVATKVSLINDRSRIIYIIVMTTQITLYYNGSYSLLFLYSLPSILIDVNPFVGILCYNQIIIITLTLWRS